MPKRTADQPDDLVSYERRFRRAGLPLFIEDYSATHDIFTRAAPLLALVFIGEMFLAAKWGWPVWANIAAVLGGCAILFGGFGLLNLARNRSFWTLPRRLGVPELAGFVLIPSVLPLIFGGQFRQALGTGLANAVLLGLIYLVVGYGLLSTVAWAVARIGGQLAISLAILVRALPVLLVFSLVLFINTEMWQVFSDMPLPSFFLVGGLFVAVGGLFMVLRLPREVRDIESSVLTGDRAADPPLTGRQRLNVGVVMLVSQALQVLVVSLGVGVFFVAFGALAITTKVHQAWGVTNDRRMLPALDLFGHEVVVTEALLRVSGGIAAFTGLYYAIAVLTDSGYRKEFFDELTAEMRDTFRLRGEYLALRARTALAAETAPTGTRRVVLRSEETATPPSDP
ncbi:MAG TPA: hypothetical protein VH912_30785 [Streptosporangiaceae bacterium]|jgi:hypothetical protein